MVARRTELLERLVQVGTDGMTEGEHHELKSVVVESHDVFAVDEGDRGEVKDVQHEVDTGDSAPVRQAPRRAPFALRAELSRLVGEMMASGVIEGSSSPWASPVVLPQVLRRLPQAERGDPEGCLPSSQDRRPPGSTVREEGVLHTRCQERLLADWHGARLQS